MLMAVQTKMVLISIAVAAHILCGSACCSPYLAIEPLPQEIVDMHCHVAGIGAQGSGCFVSSKLLHSWRFSVYLHSFGVSKRELLVQGDHVVIDRLSERLAQSRFVSRAVVLALDGVIDAQGVLDTNRTPVYVPNEFVAEQVRLHS